MAGTAGRAGAIGPTTAAQLPTCGQVDATATPVVGGLRLTEINGDPATSAATVGLERRGDRHEARFEYSVSGCTLADDHGVVAVEAHAREGVDVLLERAAPDRLVAVVVVDIDGDIGDEPIEVSFALQGAAVAAQPTTVTIEVAPHRPLLFWVVAVIGVGLAVGIVAWTRRIARRARLAQEQRASPTT